MKRAQPVIPVLSPTPENVRRAAEALRRGDLVAMPTETVYGLAGDALNPAALARIFAVKERPFFDPLIVHIPDRNWVDRLCEELPSEAAALMDRFWPGPLTLVLPKRDLVPDLATSGLRTVALRMPAHPVALALLREAATPLAAPSANPFGLLSPTRAEHVAAAFPGGIDCILDGGPCRVGVESTVLGWEDGAWTLLRAGGLTAETIEEVLQYPLSAASLGGMGGPSPGMLPSHYAPRTPLVMMDSLSPPNPLKGAFDSSPPPGAGGNEEPLGGLGGDRGLLWFGPDEPPAGFARMENLSTRGDLQEAAANLFAALHRLDNTGLERIYARLVPETGLGKAINDRLRRAAAARP